MTEEEIKAKLEEEAVSCFSSVVILLSNVGRR
jgi:hypothetical protein